MEPFGKQIDKITGNIDQFYLVPPNVGCGLSGAVVDAAINATLSQYGNRRVGQNISGQWTEIGSNNVGALMNFWSHCYLWGSMDLWDNGSGQEVKHILSRRLYSSGLTITGFEIDFVGQGVPTGSVAKLMYNNTAGTIAFSNDGTTFGTPVDVSSLINTDCIVVAQGLGFLYLRRNSSALPTADVTDTLLINDGGFSIGLGCYKSLAEGYQPFYNDVLEGRTFGLPLYAQWSQIPPYRRIISLVQQADLIQSMYSTGELFIRDELVVSATNTISDLSYIPSNPDTVMLYVNGQKLEYGASRHFEVFGNSIIIHSGADPNLDYDIETTDHVEAWYFRNPV